MKAESSQELMIIDFLTNAMRVPSPNFPSALFMLRTATIGLHKMYS